MKLHTTSVVATRSLGAALARVLRAGDVVVLSGELGGGKTAFVQGAAAGLGSADLVTSPTFTIVQEYDAAIAIAHIDVYRLERIGELYDFGFDEVIDSQRLAFIEWGELIRAALPEEYLVVSFSVGPGPDDRTIRVSANGAGWAARMPGLRDAVADFAIDGTSS